MEIDQNKFYYYKKIYNREAFSDSEKEYFDSIEFEYTNSSEYYYSNFSIGLFIEINKLEDDWFLMNLSLEEEDKYYKFDGFEEIKKYINNIENKL